MFVQIKTQHYSYDLIYLSGRSSDNTEKCTCTQPSLKEILVFKLFLSVNQMNPLNNCHKFATHCFRFQSVFIHHYKKKKQKKLTYHLIYWLFNIKLYIFVFHNFTATIWRFREVNQQIKQFSEAEDAHNYKDIREVNNDWLLEPEHITSLSPASDAIKKVSLKSLQRLYVGQSTELVK